MSQPDSGQPMNTSGTWPYGPPGQAPGYADPDAGMPGSGTRPHEEWHHDGVLPGDSADGQGVLQDLEPPPEWPDADTYVPRPNDRPSLGVPHRFAPHRPAVHRRDQWPPRSITIAALLLAAVAAVAVLMLPYIGTIRLPPTDNPGTKATGWLCVTAGNGGSRSSSSSPQRPTIAKAEAESLLSRYRMVNNEANEQQPDSLLAAIEVGSSYVPFALARAVCCIPRQSVHSPYPHWSVVAVTHASLASPDRNTAGLSIAPRQIAPMTATANKMEACR